MVIQSAQLVKLSPEVRGYFVLSKTRLQSFADLSEDCPPQRFVKLTLHGRTSLLRLPSRQSNVTGSLIVVPVFRLWLSVASACLKQRLTNL